MPEKDEYTYGSGAVYGNLAYDFNNPELYPGEVYGKPLERPKTEERVRTGVGAHAAPRTKQGIAPAAILGFAVAAVLLVIGMMARIQLVEISDVSAGLETRLAELQQEQVKLTIAYESAFNMTQVEEYATGKLGMQKPGVDQIQYIDTSAPDKAEILGEDSSGTVADKIGDFFWRIGEYFH